MPKLSITSEPEPNLRFERSCVMVPSLSGSLLLRESCQNDASDAHDAEFPWPFGRFLGHCDPDARLGLTRHKGDLAHVMYT
jgi:hypothetical protein